jgi:predicted transcriptional regulator
MIILLTRNITARDVIDDITISFLFALASFLAVFTLVLGHRLHKIFERERTERIVFEQFVSTIEQRLLRCEQRLTELMVRMDLISIEKSKGSTFVQKDVRDVSLPTQVQGTDSTQNQVLQALMSGPKTVNELRQVISRTREHTARLMKSLYERGLVSRDTRSKPYTYSITDEGKKVLSGT